MLAARVEQKNGTYLNNIQRDRQSSPSPTPVAVFGICPDRHSHHPADVVIIDAQSPEQAIAEISQPIAAFKRGKRTVRWDLPKLLRPQ
jgi:hypothetical protein